MAAAEPSIPMHPIAAPSAWRRSELQPAQYRVALDMACLGEIRGLAADMQAHPLPTIVRRPEDYDLPHCQAAMRGVRHILTAGVRFAIVDRLPVEELGAGAATAVYWILASMVARPVAQKLDGTLIYDVHDTGGQALPGSGIRPDQTNIEIKFHTDNAYNTTPPDFVSLLCLRQARSGGHSRVASFHSLYNALLRQHPAAVARLHRPFWFDRQREYHEREPAIFSAPVFTEAGELRARYSTHQIRGGYALKGEPLDNEGADAVAALLELFDDETLSADFDLEPGQMQFVDNRVLGHSRSEFEDFDEPGRRRHLVRLWLRDGGRRAYTG